MPQPEDHITTIANADRFILFPIRYPQIWEMYKKAVASFWLPEEIPLQNDVHQWQHSLSQDERTFISRLLAFLATSDGIVAENIIQRFSSEIEIAEIRYFYGFQTAVENIHAETYSILIETLVPDDTERTKLFRAITDVPTVAAKASWALKWISDPDSPLPIRLFAFALVEGLFFSSSFAAIFWLKSRGKMPGLCYSNDLISRDEGLHTDFACMLVNLLDEKLTGSAVYRMVKEAVKIECAFSPLTGYIDSLHTDLVSMNKSMMQDYIRYVADRIITAVGFPKLYNAINPFPFMDMISLPSRTNFFEKRSSEYRLPGPTTTTSKSSLQMYATIVTIPTNTDH
ncbi:ribonucleotide reductase [Coprinopsis marcescibilis]|uniref:Ribonucleotide reductase n=1 Tax=Coprinopsis marcescibilis TaxID=230819 RepID=A0A5C3L4Y3_COPMA|nr:ribonucleotide reductase [Coprinopsis marcescibilis]